MKSNKEFKSVIRHAMFIGIGAFFLAIIASAVAQTMMENLTSLLLGFVLLSLIILVGIIFDIIGIAAAVAKEAPLHSRSAKKVFGSAHAIRLVRRADAVSSFCNDVVGDVCGTLSGAVGAALIYRIISGSSETEIVIFSTFMTALIAFFTVGGKALGKNFAITNGTEIIFRVGKIIAWIEKHLHIKIIGDIKGKNKKGKRR